MAKLLTGTDSEQIHTHKQAVSNIEATECRINKEGGGVYHFYGRKNLLEA